MKTAIGLMSGTSMDGIDLALLVTDGEERVEHGPSAYVPYDEDLRSRWKRALVSARTIRSREERPDDLAESERILPLAHAAAVKSFLARNGLKAGAVDLIGFHGQTILHRPDDALTVQIGDGPLLAEETGIDVVYDMRAQDMTQGGQGAPLIPAYHAALAANLPDGLERPAVFVNIGGISNLTYTGKAGRAEELVAFDSGPGNMLIDQWVEAHTGKAFDKGGAVAARGAVVPSLWSVISQARSFPAMCAVRSIAVISLFLQLVKSRWRMAPARWLTLRQRRFSNPPRICRSGPEPMSSVAVDA